MIGTYDLYRIQPLNTSSSDSFVYNTINTITWTFTMSRREKVPTQLDILFVMANDDEVLVMSSTTVFEIIYFSKHDKIILISGIHLVIHE